MRRSIRAVGVDASSERRVTFVWTKLVPRGYGVTESPDCLDTWCHLVRVNFLPLQHVYTCMHEKKKLVVPNCGCILYILTISACACFVLIAFLEQFLSFDLYHIDKCQNGVYVLICTYCTSAIIYGST